MVIFFCIWPWYGNDYGNCCKLKSIDEKKCMSMKVLSAYGQRKKLVHSKEKDLALKLHLIQFFDHGTFRFDCRAVPLLKHRSIAYDSRHQCSCFHSHFFGQFQGFQVQLLDFLFPAYHLKFLPINVILKYLKQLYKSLLIPVKEFFQSNLYIILLGS